MNHKNIFGMPILLVFNGKLSRGNEAFHEGIEGNKKRHLCKTINISIKKVKSTRE